MLHSFRILVDMSKIKWQALAQKGKKTGRSRQVLTVVVFGWWVLFFFFFSVSTYSYIFLN
jgi:hypothetical protein